jgi:hypothetical protein
LNDLALAFALHPPFAKKTAVTLRIERSSEAELVVFTLTGRMEIQDLAELQRVLSQEQGNPGIVLDLRDIVLIDRDAVKFLANCELAGIELQNCPPYIRAWIGKEENNRL